jgi:hypothetical protein
MYMLQKKGAKGTQGMVAVLDRGFQVGMGMGMPTPCPENETALSTEKRTSVEVEAEGGGQTAGRPLNRDRYSIE